MSPLAFGGVRPLSAGTKPEEKVCSERPRSNATSGTAPFGCSVMGCLGAMGSHSSFEDAYKIAGCPGNVHQSALVRSSM